MARGMVEVELDDDAPRPVPPGPDPATEWLRRGVRAVGRAARRAGALVVRGWRVPWLRWTALAVVAALVAVPVANASRERTRLAALALIPGVQRPLHPGMTALYTLDEEDADVLGSGTLVGGTVVAPLAARDGSEHAESVVGLDVRTGERLWRTPLDPLTGTDHTTELPVCGDAGGLVACHAGEWSGDRLTTSVWVLDASDGHVVRTAAYDEHAWAAVAGGLLVVARQVDGPRRAPAEGPWRVVWQVTGEDAATGAPRWTWRSPRLDAVAEVEEQNLAHDPDDYGSWFYPAGAVRGAGDDLVLRVGDDTWVLGADGTERTHVWRPGGWGAETLRGGVITRTPLVSDLSGDLDTDGTPAAPVTELLLADGTWRPLDGDRLWTVLDDGSVPDALFFVTGGEAAPTLTAVSARTGQPMWQVPAPDGRPYVTGLVFEGRLFVAPETATGGSGRLHAYDAATGAELWAADGAFSLHMTTDGSVLLTVVPDATGFSNEVRAYALDDGRPLWQDDLRDAVRWDGEPGNLSGIALWLPGGHLGAMRSDGSLTVVG